MTRSDEVRRGDADVGAVVVARLLVQRELCVGGTGAEIFVRARVEDRRRLEVMHRLLTRLRFAVRPRDRAAGDVGPTIRTEEEWARAGHQAIEDRAREHPDTICGFLNRVRTFDSCRGISGSSLLTVSD